jgi:hypothetical protein
MSRKEPPHDEIFGTADLSPLLPEGEYEVQFVGYRKVSMFRVKIFLDFNVISSGAGNGEKLYLCCQWHKKYTDSSKFLRMWILAAGRRPDRFDRLSMEVFKGKVFRAVVRTVDRDSKQRPLSRHQQYSIIDELKEVLAG